MEIAKIVKVITTKTTTLTEVLTECERFGFIQRVLFFWERREGTCICALQRLQQRLACIHVGSPALDSACAARCSVTRLPPWFSKLQANCSYSLNRGPCRSSFACGSTSGTRWCRSQSPECLPRACGNCGFIYHTRVTESAASHKALASALTVATENEATPHARSW